VALLFAVGEGALCCLEAAWGGEDAADAFYTTRTISGAIHWPQSPLGAAPQPPFSLPRVLHCVLCSRCRPPPDPSARPDPIASPNITPIPTRPTTPPTAAMWRSARRATPTWSTSTMIWPPPSTSTVRVFNSVRCRARHNAHLHDSSRAHSSVAQSSPSRRAAPHPKALRSPRNKLLTPPPTRTRRRAAGWGTSFHFAHRWAGEAHGESLKRHEHYLALRLGLRPGDKVRRGTRGGGRLYGRPT